MLDDHLSEGRHAATHCISLHPLKRLYQPQKVHWFCESWTTCRLLLFYTGTTIDFAKASKQCTPFVTNANMNATKSYGGKPLDPSFVASPCGFTGKSSLTQQNLPSMIHSNFTIRQTNRYLLRKAVFFKTSMGSLSDLLRARAPSGATQRATTSWSGCRTLDRSRSTSFGGVSNRSCQLESTI